MKKNKPEFRSKDYIIEHYKDFGTPIQDRFGARFSKFLTKTEAEKLGIFTQEAIDNWDDSAVIEWNEENVLKQLESDVAFGFEGALNRRGISSSLMFDVVKTWNVVLGNELADWSDDDYAQYGLPLFKATAVLYGFDNPIGDDRGDEEDKYSEDADWGDEDY